MISHAETFGAAVLLVLIVFLFVLINVRLRREVRTFKARQAAFPVTFLDTSKLAPKAKDVQAASTPSRARKKPSRIQRVLLSLAHARLADFGYFRR